MATNYFDIYLFPPSILFHMGGACHFVFVLSYLLFSRIRVSVTLSLVYLSIAPSGLGKALTFSPTTWRIQAKEEKQPRTWGKDGFKFPLLQINNPVTGVDPK